MKVIECEEDNVSDTSAIGFIKFNFIFLTLISIPVVIGYLIQVGLNYGTTIDNMNSFKTNKTLICNKKTSKTLVSKSNAWRYNDEYFIKGDNVVPIVECEKFD